MSAQQNSKICFRITKLLTWVKRGWGWLGCKTMSNVYFVPSFKQEGGIHNLGHSYNPGRTPSSVCFKACVSVFLWLCSQQCFGCASTAEKGLTRCVLSETPAPLLGRGSASNPEAIFATICRQINKQIRLITEDILIRLLKQTDFTPRRTLLFTFQCREKKKKNCVHTWCCCSFKDKLTHHLKVSL